MKVPSVQYHLHVHGFHAEGQESSVKDAAATLERYAAEGWRVAHVVSVGPDAVLFVLARDCYRSGRRPDPTPPPSTGTARS